MLEEDYDMFADKVDFTGLGVEWPGSKDLAHYLRCRFYTTPPSSSLSVLELGSGCSVDVSTVCAQYVSRLALSDGNEKIAENSLSATAKELMENSDCKVTSHHLLWADEKCMSSVLDAYKDGFGMIVAAEVLYDDWVQHFQWLAQTAVGCLTASGVLVLQVCYGRTIAFSIEKCLAVANAINIKLHIEDLDLGYRKMEFAVGVESAQIQTAPAETESKLEDSAPHQEGSVHLFKLDESTLEQLQLANLNGHVLAITLA